MFDTVKRRLNRAFTTACRKLLAAWVRTRVLPQDPGTLGLDGETVCYVLELRSFSNYLVLEKETMNAGLPLPGATPEDAAQPPRVLAMSRRRGLVRRRDTHELHFEQLAALLEQAAAGREVKLVPVSIFWGRRPEREHSVFKALFSDSWVFVGPVRKFFMILLHGRNVFVQFASPISLAEFVAENEHEQKRVRKLSRVLRVHFRRRRTTTIGPDLSHRRTLVNTLLSTRAVREAIEREASKNAIPLAAAEGRARRYALEVAADYSYPVIRALDHLLSWLWNRLYDGVVVHHFETVRRVAPGHELVYVPCHRSHMDYLLLSYVLYHQGLVPPHVAAGINLNIPVIGGILRRGGAFFIRRSFKGNQLYTAVVSEYLALNFAKGVSIEYFTEGARSRTGRLLKPREGMLNMSAKSYLRYSQRPIAFVPVYIGYEKIIELPSYVHELAGAPKKSESIGGFFKSLGALWRQWGRVYLNVGEPIFLDQVFTRHEPGWRAADIGSNHRPAWLPVAVSDLARQIHTHINQAAAVNPINLVSMALLSTRKHALDEKQLIQLIDLQRALILALPDHERVTVTEIPAGEIIAYAEKMRVLQRQPHELGDVLYLDARDTVLLSYYRNNCLHLFALPALIACCLQQQQGLSRESLLALCKRAYPFLRAELFLPWGEDALGEVLDAVLDFMRDEGLLAFAENDIQAPPPNTTESAQSGAVANAALPLLQRFYLCVRLLAKRGSGALTPSELEALCRMSAQRLSLLHEFQGPDFFQQGQYRQLIGFLKKQGWISINAEERIEFNAAITALDADGEWILSSAIRQQLV